MDIRGERARAIRKVYDDFREVMKSEKCRTCACFYADMLASVLEAARRYGSLAGNGEMADIEADLKGWFDGASHLDLHG